MCKQKQIAIAGDNNGFTCGVCNKSFLSLELLQHHSRVHQVEDLSNICKGDRMLWRMCSVCCHSLECGRDLETNHNPLFGGKCLICFAKTNTTLAPTTSSASPPPEPSSAPVSSPASATEMESYHQQQQQQQQQAQQLIISRLAHLMNLTRSGL